MKLNIIIIVIASFLLSCTENKTQKNNVSIIEISDEYKEKVLDSILISDGEYVWEEGGASISIVIEQGKPFSHCIVYYSGDFIDCCNESSIKIISNSSEIWNCNFLSCYDEESYEIQIEVIDEVTLRFEMISSGHNAVSVKTVKKLKFHNIDIH